jgi:hypothetical protein
MLAQHLRVRFRTKLAKLLILADRCPPFSFREQ